MDAKRKESRYSKWVEILSNWQNSGLNKRGYCVQNSISGDWQQSRWRARDISKNSCQNVDV